jgi:hypothetical protein
VSAQQAGVCAADDLQGLAHPEFPVFEPQINADYIDFADCYLRNLGNQR